MDNTILKNCPNCIIDFNIYHKHAYNH